VGGGSRGAVRKGGDGDRWGERRMGVGKLSAAAELHPARLPLSSSTRRRGSRGGATPEGPSTGRWRSGARDERGMQRVRERERENPDFNAL
jgi:hypothetical protein